MRRWKWRQSCAVLTSHRVWGRGCELVWRNWLQLIKFLCRMAPPTFFTMMDLLVKQEESFAWSVRFTGSTRMCMANKKYWLKDKGSTWQTWTSLEKQNSVTVLLGPVPLWYPKEHYFVWKYNKYICRSFNIVFLLTTWLAPALAYFVWSRHGTVFGFAVLHAFVCSNQDETNFQ
jgi:hypothetical protein